MFGIFVAMPFFMKISFCIKSSPILSLIRAPMLAKNGFNKSAHFLLEINSVGWYLCHMSLRNKSSF